MDDGYFLMLTSNFRDILFQFRLRDRVRLLWADAVCINQKDDADKTRQIPRMAQIYSGASCVLVWLGNDPGSAKSLHQLSRFAKRLHMHSIRETGSHNTTARESEDGLGILFGEASQVLQSILELPWFSRLWVIQEVALNPDVVMYCGSARLTWSSFFQAVRSIKTQASWSVLPSTVCDLWMIRAFGLKATSRFDTLRLLQDLSSAKCSDDRDRVWALSALAQDLEFGIRERAKYDYRERLCLNVDYSTDVVKLYMEIARSVLKKETDAAGHKSMLLVCASIRSDGSQSSDSIPSWAPDWRLPPLRKPLVTSRDIREVIFIETPVSIPIGWFGLSYCYKCEPRMKTAVRGSLRLTDQVDTRKISWVGEPFPEDSTQSSIAAWIRRSIISLMSYDEQKSAVLQKTVDMAVAKTWHFDFKRALPLLMSLLATGLGVHGKIEFNLLLSWVGNIPRSSEESSHEMQDGVPGVHLSDHNYMSHRTLFAFAARTYNSPRDKFPIGFGLGPDHMDVDDVVPVRWGPIIDNYVSAYSTRESLQEWRNTDHVGSLIFRKVNMDHELSDNCREFHTLIGDALLVFDKSADIIPHAEARSHSAGVRDFLII